MSLEQLGLAGAGVFFGGCAVVLVFQWVLRRRARRAAVLRATGVALDCAVDEVLVEVATFVVRVLT